MIRTVSTLPEWEPKTVVRKGKNVTVQDLLFRVPHISFKGGGSQGVTKRKFEDEFAQREVNNKVRLC